MMMNVHKQLNLTANLFVLYVHQLPKELNENEKGITDSIVKCCDGNKGNEMNNSTNDILIELINALSSWYYLWGLFWNCL